MIYPPSIRTAPEVPRWAAERTARDGTDVAPGIDPLRARRIGACVVDCRDGLHRPRADRDSDRPADGIAGVVSWDDVIGQKQAWNVLIWFGTLVTLAGGLAETGFVGWLAKATAPTFTGLSLGVAIMAIVGTFFVLHYFFASITAHTATLLPVFLAVAITITPSRRRAGRCCSGIHSA